MTVDAWRYEPGLYDHEAALRKALPQRKLAGAALGCVALACAWTLCVNLAGSDAGRIDGQIGLAGTRGDRLDLGGVRGEKLAAAKRALSAALNAALPSTVAADTNAALFDPHYTLGRSPGTFADNIFAGAAAGASFAKSAPLQAQDLSVARTPAAAAIRQAQLIPATPPAGANPNKDAPNKGAVTPSAASAVPPPLPPIRNASLRERSHVDRIAASAPAEPTIFEKIFGLPAAKPTGPVLAYAAPGDVPGVQGGLIGGYDAQTAVYDISARTVYMPDGSRLEAHSGYGSLLDDPRHADAKDRGVTPPNVYDLELREAPFHGVQALRLIPEDDGKVFGRSGLLAHSFMLGPNGDSNGCVSFRNYDAFLHAYMNHTIKRLVVVAGQG